MIQTVGIIGAGTMGNGIAQVCAAAGLSVVMVDISDAAVNLGLLYLGSSGDVPDYAIHHDARVIHQEEPRA